MRCKELGDTGVRVSVIGMGTIGAGSYRTASAERIKTRLDVLRRGVELGITFLDTGEDYEGGHAEELLGKAIKGIRDKVFISSKFKPAHNSRTGVFKAVDGSLKRLDTDYIDLYQVQWPNPSIPVTETMSALSGLIEKGKIRYAGVCNFSLNQLKDAQAAFSGKIVSIQTEYNLNNRSIEPELLPYCRQNKVTMIAYNLFSQGSLNLDEAENKILKAIARKHQATVSQVIISWVISRRRVIALTNTMSLKHLEENAAAAAIKLDEADINKINETFHKEPVMVPTDRIRVIPRDADVTHVIYTTLDEALRNPAGIRPSPAALAEEIKSGNLLRPVELARTRDISGRYDYDLIHGRNRYWAWIIARGPKTPIPAYVIDGSKHS